MTAVQPIVDSQQQQCHVVPQCLQGPLLVRGLPQIKAFLRNSCCSLGYLWRTGWEHCHDSWRRKSEPGREGLGGYKKDQKLKHKPTWQPFIFFLGDSTFLKRVCFPISFVSHIQMYPCVCKCISQQQWSIKYQWSLSCRKSSKIISFDGCQEKKGPWLRMF